jgi:ribosomal protein S18 acetylase RimI-like enzyme
MGVSIRDFSMADYDAVVALWRAAGLVLSRSDSPEGIRHKLDRDPDLFLVGLDGNRIVAAVLGCYDGRRAWVNHLAVAPELQGRSIGPLLLDELERRLRAKGCTKVNLLIEPGNAAVQGFYRRQGYHADELIFMEKWIDGSAG